MQIETLLQKIIVNHLFRALSAANVHKNYQAKPIEYRTMLKPILEIKALYLPRKALVLQVFLT